MRSRLAHTPLLPAFARTISTISNQLAFLCMCADSSAASDAAAAPTSRRAVLAAIWAAPVLCEAALGSLRAAHASGGPRMLTTAEAAAVQQAFASVLPKARAPVVLRLAFHDAGTYDSAAGNGGANASILFELDRPESIRLGRGWRVIEDAAEKLKGTAAEGAVSLADLVALAGAYAVRITGGPEILVPIGAMHTDACTCLMRCLPFELMTLLAATTNNCRPLQRRQANHYWIPLIIVIPCNGAAPCRSGGCGGR